VNDPFFLTVEDVEEIPAESLARFGGSDGIRTKVNREIPVLLDPRAARSTAQPMRGPDMAHEIPVATVVAMIADGMSHDEILAACWPNLTWNGGGR
jgi:hypothetical protein